MLAVNKDPSGSDFARRAMEMFPACYPMALLGASTYPPGEAPAVVLAALDRYAPGLGANERPVALVAFRDAVMAAVKSAPPGTDVVPLLSRACEVFPESPRLAAQFGDALYAAGRSQEAHEQHARALALRNHAAVAREEFPKDDPPPLLWQFADHIRTRQS